MQNLHLAILRRRIFIESDRSLDQLSLLSGFFWSHTVERSGRKTFHLPACETLRHPIATILQLVPVGSKYSADLHWLMATVNFGRPVKGAGHKHDGREGAIDLIRRGDGELSGDEDIFTEPIERPETPLRQIKRMTCAGERQYTLRLLIGGVGRDNQCGLHLGRCRLSNTPPYPFAT